MVETIFSMMAFSARVSRIQSSGSVNRGYAKCHGWTKVGIIARMSHNTSCCVLLHRVKGDVQGAAKGGTQRGMPRDCIKGHTKV